LVKLLNNRLFTLLLAPFLLGSTTILSFAPYNITFINFITFPLLLFLILSIKNNNNNNRNFFYLGTAFGFGFFLFGNYWISISLTHDEIYKALIPFALILIPLFLSLFLGIAIFIVGPYIEKKIFFVLFFSLIISIFEFLRGNILTGFPWNLMAYTWSWSIETIQILSLVGTYSLSLMSITIFCIPFIFFNNLYDKKNIIFALIIFLLFSGNYLYGINKTKNNYKFDENYIIKIISPNFSLEEYKKNSEIEQLKQLIKLSNPQKNKKTLFIWPEGIFYDSYLQDIKKYKKLFANAFSNNHLIILGINNFSNSTNTSNKKYFNSLVILNNELEILFKYNKINLVPFGEFLPFEHIFSKLGFKKVTPGYSSFSPGTVREIINLGSNWGNKLILPLICYEIIYSGKIKKKNQNPDLIINISEDAWFGDSIGPYQHYAKAIYRAVEEGVFIARSANKGISSFIDPNGRALRYLNISESGTLEHEMPYFSQKTSYSIYGNKIFVLIILIYIFLIIILKKFKI